MPASIWSEPFTTWQEVFGRNSATSFFAINPNLSEPHPFLSFGSWVGTDRDGNPNITPATSKDAAEQVRQSILRYYHECCRRMLGLASFPCRHVPEIKRDLDRLMRRFPATRAFREVDQPSELYRRKLRVMMWRLDQTVNRARGAYRLPEEFTRDLRQLERLLAHHPSSSNLQTWSPQASCGFAGFWLSWRKP